MTAPIVFVSRSRVRAGRLVALRAFLDRGVPAIEREKPGTLAFLPYVDESGDEVAILHVFADPASMAAHFEGLGERMAAAAPFIETLGYEVFGQPDEATLAMLRSLASDGVTLEVWPEYPAGYLRLARG